MLNEIEYGIKVIDERISCSNLESRVNFKVSILWNHEDFNSQDSLIIKLVYKNLRENTIVGKL